MPRSVPRPNTPARRPAAFAFLLVSLVVSAALAGENWPQFRGPGGQGISEARGVPAQWGPEKNVAWKRPVPGKGWSSPVLDDGRIYLTTAVPIEGGGEGDLSLRAMCLSAADGRVLWDNEVFVEEGAKAPRVHGKNSHASPTPIVDSGRIYVYFGHEGAACLDLDGQVLWRNNSFFYEPVHGNGGSPALTDTSLIVSCDGNSQQIVMALDRATGEILWKSDRQTDAPKKFSFGTPLIIEVGSQRQAISTGSNAVCSYDPGSGREIWRVRYEGYSLIPRPVFGHDLVFLSTGYDRPSVLAIRPDGVGDVTDTHVAWRYEKAAPHTPSPLLVGDELYLVSDHGVAACLDAETGHVHWEKRIGGNFSASPVWAEGRVYLQSEEGVGTVILASKEYHLLATNDLAERSLASYAVSDGALFIRTEKNLYRIEEK